VDARTTATLQTGTVLSPDAPPDCESKRISALSARGLLVATLAAGLIGLIGHGPMAIAGAALSQADTRALGLLPNAVNVLSHLPLLVVALLAGRACLGSMNSGPLRVAAWHRGWALLFACIAIGALAGAAFHGAPSAARQLLVDAAIASASALVTLLFLAERLDLGLLRPRWLWVAILSGPAAAAVAMTGNDVRWLLAIEYLPLVLVPLTVWRLPSRGMPGRDWIVALAINLAAHLASWADAPLWRLSQGTIGGLALSHLLLALCVAWLARSALSVAPRRQARATPMSGTAASQDSTSLTTSG
jgi:hypothetical protein